MPPAIKTLGYLLPASEALRDAREREQAQRRTRIDAIVRALEILATPQAEPEGVFNNCTLL